MARVNGSHPVYLSADALSSDRIILVNRVKPRTDFKDKMKSGLMKMAVIGLGKQETVETLHSHEMQEYHGSLIINHSPLILGLAIIPLYDRAISYSDTLDHSKNRFRKEAIRVKLAEFLLGNLRATFFSRPTQS